MKSNSNRRTAPVTGLERPTCIEDVVEMVRGVGSEAEFGAFMSKMRALVSGPPKKHVGALTGRRVIETQNWLYEQNTKWRLTDLQLLAVMRVEFPLNEGEVFTANVPRGLAHIASIRADYNRTGHGGPRPHEKRLEPSISYGRVAPGDNG